jgi:hypothetical protein
LDGPFSAAALPPEARSFADADLAFSCRLDVEIGLYHFFVPKLSYPSLVGTFNNTNGSNT